MPAAYPQTPKKPRHQQVPTSGTHTAPKKPSGIFSRVPSFPGIPKLSTNIFGSTVPPLQPAPSSSVFTGPMPSNHPANFSPGNTRSAPSAPSSQQVLGVTLNSGNTLQQ